MARRVPGPTSVPPQPHRGYSIAHRPFPAHLRADNGPEFTTRAVPAWLGRGRSPVRPFTQPGSPRKGTATSERASTASCGTSYTDREILYTLREAQASRSKAGATPTAQPPPPQPRSGTAHPHLKPPRPHPHGPQPPNQPQPERRTTPQHQHKPPHKHRGQVRPWATRMPPHLLAPAGVRLLRHPSALQTCATDYPCAKATSASRSLPMICSGAYRRRAIASPFPDPHPHIEGGQASGGQVTGLPLSDPEVPLTGAVSLVALPPTAPAPGRAPCTSCPPSAGPLAAPRRPPWRGPPLRRRSRSCSRRRWRRSK